VQLPNCASLSIKATTLSSLLLGAMNSLISLVHHVVILNSDPLKIITLKLLGNLSKLENKCDFEACNHLLSFF
jgi:hypothetical protein